MQLVPLKTWFYHLIWGDNIRIRVVLCVWGGDYNVLKAHWMWMQICKLCASFSCEWSNSLLSANPNKGVSDRSGHHFQASQCIWGYCCHPSERSILFWFQRYHFSLLALSSFCAFFTDFISFVQSININGCKCSQVISFLFQISPNGWSHPLP